MWPLSVYNKSKVFSNLPGTFVEECVKQMLVQEAFGYHLCGAGKIFPLLCYISYGRLQ